jgi:16S rRNA C1402 N4-methylase RsmH
MHQEPKNISNELHVPVLLDHVLRYLNPQAGESYLDLTAGYGGHAAEVLQRTGKPDNAVLVDRDENAIMQLQQRFGSVVDLRHTDFLQASNWQKSSKGHGPAIAASTRQRGPSRLSVLPSMTSWGW